jgi:hypothetical protein
MWFGTCLLAAACRPSFAFAVFHAFSKVFLHLMEGEEISFRTYGAVSFQPGALISFGSSSR